METEKIGVREFRENLTAPAPRPHPVQSLLQVMVEHGHLTQVTEYLREARLPGPYPIGMAAHDGQVH